jgi:hypothetical protein
MNACPSMPRSDMGKPGPPHDGGEKRKLPVSYLRLLTWCLVLAYSLGIWTLVVVLAGSR